MKKNTFSLVEKKILRTLLVIFLVQLLIIVAFIRMFSGSQPIDKNDIQQVEITVEDTLEFKAPSEFWLIVYSESEKYVFTGGSTFDKFSISELYDAISIGDNLYLSYYESFTVLGKTNVIVDARNATETYRSFEEYNKSKQGAPIVVIVIFSVIELILITILLIYVWLNQKSLKKLLEKIKQILKNTRHTGDGSAY